MFLTFIMFCLVSKKSVGSQKAEEDSIEIYDLTQPTNWEDLSNYYGAVEKHWKMCINCGSPSLGTAIHLEHTASSSEAMHPAIIPSEYLLTKLLIIDASPLTEVNPSLVLSLEVGLQWPALKRDPRSSTLLLFKFAWNEERKLGVPNCICKIPGLSYELAEWITTNLTHVVGVATDAPSLESDQTREYSSRTVSNLLGKSGIYMIENVNVRKAMPEQGCMTIASPLKLLHANYVPTRLTAYCPKSDGSRQVALSLKENTNKQASKSSSKSRIYDVNLVEILS